MVEEVEKAPDDDDAALEYTLKKPILAMGEEKTVLKFREPTGADLIAVQNPVIFYPYAVPVKIEHDMPKMVAMIARLANIPSSSVAQISPQDLIGIAWLLSPFFLPAL
jgi:hypothetical protein